MSTTPSLRIPLRLQGAPGVAYARWPVSQGIPFAEGALPAGMPVTVRDAAGRAIPTQATPLSMWEREGRSVRWLLVDFLADLPAGGEAEYTLEVGVEPPAPEDSVRVERLDRETLRIDTGALQWDFRILTLHLNTTGERNPFLGARARTEQGWRELFGPRNGPVLYMMDEHGVVYDSAGAGPRADPVIEEEGPLRTTVRLRGVHAAPNGVAFCPYDLRVHFHAGSGDVRIQHTFVFNQEPHAVALRGVGMEFGFDAGTDLLPAVGGETGAHWSEYGGELVLHQEDDQRYDVHLDGERFGEGTRAPGWASLNGTRAAAAAAVPRFWQEYPAGLRVHRGGIDVRLWPEEHPEPMRFTTPFEETAIRFPADVWLEDDRLDEEKVASLLAEHPTAPLNLKSFNVRTQKRLAEVERVVEKLAPGRAASHNDTGPCNGAGAAKTHEIYLRLCAGPIPTEEAARFGAAAAEPLVAPAAPDYACGTGAFGPFLPEADDRFEGLHENLDFLLDSIVREPRERCRRFGKFVYGNLPCSHAPGPTVAYIRHRDTNPEKALAWVGPYNNEANDQIFGVWGNALRTGRREHILLARAYSRAVADVGVIHDHPSLPGLNGLMHYHNCHQWSGGPSPSHTLIEGQLVDYCLTGDRRILDVCRESADWAVRNQEPAGLLPNRGGILFREFTGPLWNLFAFYHTTWEERYGDVAVRSLRWLLEVTGEERLLPSSIFTGGKRGDEAHIQRAETYHWGACEIHEMLRIAWRILPDEALREFVRINGEYMLWESCHDQFVTARIAREHLTPRSNLWPAEGDWYFTDWGDQFLSHQQMLCLAWEITGDLRYAAAAKYAVEGYFSRLAARFRRFSDWRFTWVRWGSVMPRLAAVAAEAMDRDPEGLAAAEKEWREKRAEKGLPIYDGPPLDLETYTMEVNGNITSHAPTELPREKPVRVMPPPEFLRRIEVEPMR